ncbi:MAG: pyridoxal-phosphate-dependent aminotransferase family protein [Acidimicrobiales bacterium]
MPVCERLLMGPGPSNPYPRVMAALAQPTVGHMDPQFFELLDETCERLRVVFGCTNPLTLPISGTGSAGMEAALLNIVGRGDKVVVGVNGLFGERMCEIARRAGGHVTVVRADWGRPLDPDALTEAGRDAKVIALVHAETSTGVRNDVAAVAAGKGDSLLLADVVTSLGGIEVDVAQWGVDVAYGGTQKCLGVPPGLAPLTMNERAQAALVSPPTSWYFDLGLISQYTEGSGRRLYHHTAPVNMVYALHAGLGVVLEEGLAESWSRHAHWGTQLQARLEELGLELLVPAEWRLPQLTTVFVPTRLAGGMDEAEARHALLERYGIEIGGGVGPLAGSIWRIGCMGYNARESAVDRLIEALSEVIER